MTVRPEDISRPLLPPIPSPSPRVVYESMPVTGLAEDVRMYILSSDVVGGGGATPSVRINFFCYAYYLGDG